jgi:hypothetical protein
MIQLSNNNSDDYDFESDFFKPRHNIFYQIIQERERFKDELGLDPAIATVLEEFHRSNWSNPRIKDRERLFGRKFTDTQVTSLRRRSIRIWGYIHQLLDFRDRLRYALYDLSVGCGRDIEELKKMQGILCRRNDYLLRYHSVDLNDPDSKNIPFEHALDISSYPVRDQAEQLVKGIRQKLEDEDEKDENYTKLDPLVYGVMRDFYYSNWESPGIESRETFKRKYTDAQITSARRKALKSWPYVRFIMDLRHEPEGGPLEGAIHLLLPSYTIEVQELKKLETIILKRNDELLRYNSILSEINSQQNSKKKNES